MKRLALALAAFSVAMSANAQIYQWKDEGGKTIISDKPPVGANTAAKKIDSATPAAASNQKTLADRELDMRKRQKEAQDNSEKAAKEQAASNERAKNCESARRYLQTLESGERVSMRDDKGERYFMEDAQREQEIASTRQSIQSNCAN